LKDFETVRTHDKFYLNEDRKRTPKSYFKFVLNEIDSDFAKNASIVDIGCATGDFIWFLQQNFPDAELVGVDVDEQLLQRARAEVPSAEFFRANIVEDKIDKQYDLVFFLSVHAIWDSAETWLNPLVDLVREKKKSAVYVFGLFNPEDVDVMVRSRKSSSDGPWETGWNIISKKTVRDYCENKGWECSFKNFQIDVELEKNESDPLRSYTLMMKDDQPLVVNGLQIVHQTSLLTIRPYQ
jgi:trans-aconitate methyltransferase